MIKDLKAIARNKHMLDHAIRKLTEDLDLGEKDYHVVTVGHSGFFKATCAANAKHTLLEEIMVRNKLNGQPKLTRSQRRYLLNRAVAQRVS